MISTYGSLIIAGIHYHKQRKKYKKIKFTLKSENNYSFILTSTTTSVHVNGTTISMIVE